MKQFTKVIEAKLGPIDVMNGGDVWHLKLECGHNALRPRSRPLPKQVRCVRCMAHEAFRRILKEAVAS